MSLSSLLPHIPPGVTPLSYYLLVGTAVVIIGISKAGFGGGTGILGIPLLALAAGTTQGLGITLPLLIICDVFSNLHYIGQYDWRRLRWLLVGAVGGVVVGTFLFALLIHLNISHAGFDNLMALIVGAVCLSVVALQAYRLTGREIPTLPPHPASATTVGLVAGTLSTLNNAAGPIVTIYLLQEKLEKRILVGTQLLYFLLINTCKVPTYVYFGFTDRQTLHDSIWFLPLIPLSTLAGAWLHHRVSERLFSVIMYTAAGIAAADLIRKALGWKFGGI